MAALTLMFAALLAVGAAAATWWGAVRLWEHRRTAGAVAAVVIGTGILLWQIGAVAQLAGSPDLPEDSPAGLQHALHQGAGCRADWPLARVSDLKMEAEGWRKVRATCTWSVLGWPRFRLAATCVDGQWEVTGFNHTRPGGSCQNAPDALGAAADP